ncbi:MAG: tRNA dihydrouridine(20/20a) synthase DusA [Candidatus Pelagibacter sp. TMED202]|nr:MAG: tRNA dihydrouridine(20/20a) synthase DusA [Candidatus Pelagibacter sp. TMED202]|tara:strand:+ start:1683 stop:2666 length:984 start_codon:yes stop_codon:yes gene_type:complete
MKKTVSVAPMMDCTDRHEIYFLSLISKNVQLYTEMIVANAIIRGNRDKLLSFKKISNPIVLQVGGSDPKELFEACKISEDYGYNEINLNLGCPSKKVQKNKFGACLMQEPNLVATCIESMAKATKLPITIKTRIGYNEVENFGFLKSFIQTTKDAGAQKFIIHARKALLKKLSPKENLNIPPLKYDFVYKLKNFFKNDEIIINGGVKTTSEIKDHLSKVDGVMIGRAIYHSPYFLAEIEKEIFNNNEVPSRTEVMEKLIPYIQEQTSKGIQLNHIMRHTVGLFHGQNGSRIWKQYLSKNMCIRDADLQKVNHIMDHIRKTNPVSLER